MISTRLIDDIVSHLKEAEEVWIAVALMKDAAFSDIQLLTPANTRQNYLVGIDLPTSPTVLRTLQVKQSKNFAASIFHNSNTFHPKIYLIKKKEGFIAFVGSSNLTTGGLQGNIEMNITIADPEICQSLLQWFNDLRESSYPLSDENITEYEKSFDAVSEIERKKKEIPKIRLKKLEKSDDPLEGIDFSDRFFKKEHHSAFRPMLWEDDSVNANKERGKAKDQFLELHDIIYPQFEKYGLTNIFPNVKNHIVSMDYHFPGQTSQQLNAMWLSYGKSQHEIRKYHEIVSGGYRLPRGSNNEEDDKQSFINHARLQVRIELKEIGIWILFGKNNEGSVFDRDHFSKKMKVDEYRNSFFKAVKGLSGNYRITINKVTKNFTEFSNPDQLHAFCKTDRPENYFIIGIDYNIPDPKMSELFLPQTVLTEFQRLYPIYEMMTDRRFSNT